MKRCKPGFRREKGKCTQRAPEGQEHYMYYIRGRDVKKVDRGYVNMEAVGSASLIGYCGRSVEGVPIFDRDRRVIDKESLP